MLPDEREINRQYVIQFLKNLKDLFIFLYEYTIALFRRTRRGHQTPLEMAVSWELNSGPLTSALNRQAIAPASPPPTFCFLFLTAGIEQGFLCWD